MNEKTRKTLLRRDLLRFGIVGVSSALIGSQVQVSASANLKDPKDKRRARYQANSPEVRNFYRVNSYPAR
jgi:hypothetical protein